MPPARVLSVGQCGFDHGLISQHLGRSLGTEVIGARTHREALEALQNRGPFRLVLVNRIGDSDGASGLDFIRTLKADTALAEIPVMLVSNYPEAQEQAVALGALRGFGKAELGRPGFDERLKPLLGEFT